MRPSSSAAKRPITSAASSAANLAKAAHGMRPRSSAASSVPIVPEVGNVAQQPRQDLDAIEADLAAKCAHYGYDISKVSPGNLRNAARLSAYHQEHGTDPTGETPLALWVRDMCKEMCVDAEPQFDLTTGFRIMSAWVGRYLCNDSDGELEEATREEGGLGDVASDSDSVYEMIATADLLNMVPGWNWGVDPKRYRQQNGIEADLEERYHDKTGSYPTNEDFCVYRYKPDCDEIVPNAARFREHHRVYGTEPKQGTTLGNWVKNMRARYKREELKASVITLLSVVPEWRWEVGQTQKELRAATAISEKFKENAEAFRQYREKHNADPPQGKPLGKWVDNMRQRRRKETLTAAECELLTDTPGWRWDARR